VLVRIWAFVPVVESASTASIPGGSFFVGGSKGPVLADGTARLLGAAPVRECQGGAPISTGDRPAHSGGRRVRKGGQVEPVRGRRGLYPRSPP
jgi:hypothetical protein